ncbi:MAG: peptidase M28 family protein, partial [Xanthomarina sp.]
MRFTFLIFSLFFILNVSAQTDEEILKGLYKTALTNGHSYSWLDHLSNQIGGRLSGSLNAERAVEYTKGELEKLGLDKVWLQPVMVPKWVRGAPEFAFIETAFGGTTNVNICALGGSVATPLGGLKAHVVEVKSLEELEVLGKENIEGKIVFFNQAMKADIIQTFEAYGTCASQRYSGALEASKYGAVG